MKETITSVGIDIGTSTTQLIFSRLTIENLASSYTVPRISIVDKEVIYRSNIYFTPLKSQQEIDVEAVRKIVKEEYEKAGMTPDMLQTGAVIITGETARKQNANLVLEMLSDMAGDFVVATAGVGSFRQRSRCRYHFRGGAYLCSQCGYRRRHQQHRFLL